MGPINYSSPILEAMNSPTMAERMVQMQHTMAQTGGLEQQVREKQHALQEQQAFIRDLQRVGSNPSASEYAYLMRRYPKAHEGLKAGWDLTTKDAADGDLRTLSDIFSSGLNKRWDLAGKVARARYEADEKVGLNDPNDEEYLRIIESGTDEERKALLGILGWKIAARTGKDHMGAAIKNIGEEARQMDLHPIEVRKDAAEAQTAEAEAQNAPAYYAGRARGEVADAEIKEVDSAWRAAEKAAEVNLKREQVASLKSLISTRAKELDIKLNEVSVEDVMAPVYEKVARGDPLSAGEAAAWAAYTKAPTSQRRRSQPAVQGGGQGGRGGGQRAAAPPAPRQPIVKQFRNKATGQMEPWKLVNGKWVRA